MLRIKEMIGAMLRRSCCVKRFTNLFAGRSQQRYNCEAHSTVRFFDEARIINSAGVPSAITIGSDTIIRGELLTFFEAGSITIGRYCFIGEGTRIWSAKRIVVGDRVLISHHVNIFDNDTHPIDDVEARHRQFLGILRGSPELDVSLNERAVHIEDDVLIGCQAVILKGVTIGAGSVIGAGAVVTKDVPPRVVVAGNPAQIIRHLDF